MRCTLAVAYVKDAGLIPFGYRVAWFILHRVEARASTRCLSAVRHMLWLVCLCIVPFVHRCLVWLGLSRYRA